jgi:nucleoside-diphosphate-sugar epimerase
LNFLITGGSGFIGRSLVAELSKLKNAKIYVVDKVNHNFNLNNVYFLKVDIGNFNTLKKINIKIDYIYHLAADLGVQKIVKNPLKCLKNNLITTENIILFSKIKKIKRLFFFSTSEVYSLTNNRGKMEEKDNLQIPSISHPRTAYWLSKVYGEFLTIRSNIPYTIFRIFNVYGPNLKTTHVIPSIFIKLKNIKDAVFENPCHSRCFLYIDDAIYIFVNALKRSFKNQIVNVANPSEEIKIKDLVEKIKKMMNIKSKITYKNINNLSIRRRMPSIQKVQKLPKTKLKFTKLDKGLLILKNYYENKN